MIHFQVRYNVKQWLEKNKDPLNDTAVTVLKTSKENKLMLDIWDDYKTQEDIAKMGRSRTDSALRKGGITFPE